MTDRDRLIELLTDNLPRCGNLPQWDNPLQLSCDEQVERIADHLLANGVIVPPCKVGDKVYFIDTCTTAEDFGKKYVSWDNVLQLSFNCFGEWVLLTDKRIVDIGEVFLTKEEAEAKLKECEKE